MDRVLDFRNLIHQLEKIVETLTDVTAHFPNLSFGAAPVPVSSVMVVLATLPQHAHYIGYGIAFDSSGPTPDRLDSPMSPAICKNPAQ